MALGVAGLGCEDALTHLLNYVWPNIFETSPHVVNAVMGAIDGCRLALGPAIVLNYTLQARAPRPGCRILFAEVASISNYLRTLPRYALPPCCGGRPAAAHQSPTIDQGVPAGPPVARESAKAGERHQGCADGWARGARARPSLARV
jgi:hypothetical protein